MARSKRSLSPPSKKAKTNESSDTQPNDKSSSTLEDSAPATEASQPNVINESTDTQPNDKNSSTLGDSAPAAEASQPNDMSSSTIVSSAAQQYMTHLAKMYMDGQTADVQFVIKSAGCADEIIPAHKILLVATSAVFRTMFYGSVPETGNVTITDTTSNAFKKFLEWFYYSNPVITMQTIEGVLYLAHKYDVESCFNACSTFLIDNMDKDILLAYNLGNKYDLSNVKEKCQSMFDASSAYYTSKPYLECSQDTFEKIVQFPFIPAKRKFELCMTWSENGCKRLKQDPKHMTYRRALLRNCIDHIDFNAMSPNEFHDCIEQSFGLFSYSKMQRLLLGFAKKHM